MRSVRSPEPKLVLEAQEYVAHSSPDHVEPWGTKRDNSRNPRFNQKLYRLYSDLKSPLRILDLGCSGGAFVRDCINDGCFAIGIEGSDYSKEMKRCEWAVIPEFLFTADITRKFRFYMDDGVSHSPVHFDVITMWEVIEHIAESDLAVVAENVKAHLKTNGLWIMSVSPNEEIINGVRLHQTVQQKPWWIETFKRLGFVNLESLVRYFNGQFVRGPKQNAPGSFHLVLTLNPASAPSAPRLRCRDYIYDCWLYSKPQKLLRLLVGNIAG